jgi:hypothetical protein
MAMICSSLLVLPACIPNLRKADPGPPLPEDLSGATSSENSSQVGVEEFFNDPTLIGLIDQALVGNQELRILNENVQIASNEVLARRGAYLPCLTAGGGVSAAKPSLYTPEGAVEKQYQALGGGLDYLSRKDPAVPASPHVAAAACAQAMPATAPNDLADPDPQPGDPSTSQSGSAADVPSALP